MSNKPLLNPDVKDKLVVGDFRAKMNGTQLESNTTAKPTVSDDFKYDFKYNYPLPTSDVLGIQIPDDCNVEKETKNIVEKLAECMSSGDATTFTTMFLEYGVWRDKLAFTWDYRTFNFRPAILKAASDLFPSTKATNFSFLRPPPKFLHPYPDFAFLQFVVAFETEIVEASAVVNCVLSQQGWRIYAMHTVAESLRQFPEISPSDGHMTGSMSWEKQRAQEIDSADPEILIVGGGQNGLALAARCKALGMDNLIIERSDRIGNVWKNRYEYLSLQFPHWPDDLPYFNYPKHWPTHTPAQKQALYMQWYASAMELNIWTKSSVVAAEQDEAGNWTVTISKGGNEPRVLHPKQVVMATSLCGIPMIPTVPGLSDFKGIIRHSAEHDSGHDFVGKNVCVVGTSSSGFDTAFDFSKRGIDVTLLQRSPTCVMSLEHSVPRLVGKYAPDVKGNRPNLEDQDRLFFSMPLGPAEELSRRTAKVIEDLDQSLLNALNAKGLRTWSGQRGTGYATLGQTRSGGFYFDSGACEHIINGRIRVESGYIQSFTEDKVILNGNRERDFDLVVFATGYTNMIDSIRDTLGDIVAAKCGPIWGIDEEGETKTAWKETGISNFWIMVGILPMTRYHSKLLALRLKALSEGISPPPYRT